MIRTFNLTPYLFTLLLLGLGSCTSDPLDVDVSSIEIDMELLRLDEAVFDMDWRSNRQAQKELKAEYQGYYTFYSEFILNNPSGLSDSIMQYTMMRFALDKTMLDFYKAESALYGGDKFDPYFDEIQNAFRHYKYYFPGEAIPTLFLYQSGFNYKIVPNDTLLGIGIEWFIGKDNELIKKLSQQAFPAYEKEKMQPDFLVVDAVKGFLKVKYQDYQQMDNLLSVMVFYGKIMYLTDALLHDKDDAVKMNYSAEEWNWLKSNEKQIWTYIAENNLLFSNDLREISQWVNDGPFTIGLPQESPSRAGIFMGWQMVRQYMKKHPETNIKELMEMQDYNRILSAYKPK
jgi:hypothetical protein